MENKWIGIVKRVKWGRVAIALGLLFCMVYAVVNLTKSTFGAVPGLFDKADEIFVASVLEKHEQVEVTIRQGETVWEVQEELLGKDHPYNMYDILYVLSEINGGYDDWSDVNVGSTFLLLQPKN